MTSDRGFIFVAGDDDRLVATITDALRERGFRVASASGHAADRVRFDTELPTVVVLDTSMPAGRQADLLNRLRPATDQLTPAIVALSSRESVRQVARLPGVWVCLAKPVALDRLVGAVERISRYTAEQSLRLIQFDSQPAA